MTTNETRLAEALREKITRLRAMRFGEFYLAGQIFADDLERILAAHSAARAQAAPDWPDGPDREPPAQPASVANGWRVIRYSGIVGRNGDRWEVYDPSGSGGVVRTSDVRLTIVRNLLDALAAAPRPTKEVG